jgi:hypothetical protein
MKKKKKRGGTCEEKKVSAFALFNITTVCSCSRPRKSSH